MNLIVNMCVRGIIKEYDKKLYLDGYDFFENKIKIYFINEDKKNIDLKEFKRIISNVILNSGITESIVIENKINNIIDGKTFFTIKNGIGSNSTFNAIFIEKNIELINKNEALINLDIKYKDNEKFKSASLYDLIKKNDSFLDYSTSLNEYNNINIINRFFEIIESNIDLNIKDNAYNFGIKELDFIKKLNIKSFNDVDIANDIFELKKFANKKGYHYTLLNYFYKEYYRLEEQSKLLDLFIISKENKDIQKIKKSINSIGLENSPIFINFKIKFNNISKILFKDNIINNIYGLLNFYYSIISDENKKKIGSVVDGLVVYNDHFLKSIYLNNLVFMFKIPNDSNNFKVTKLYSYTKFNKKNLSNVSGFGLTSNLIKQFDDFINNKV